MSCLLDSVQKNLNYTRLTETCMYEVGNTAQVIYGEFSTCITDTQFELNQLTEKNVSPSLLRFP